MGGAGVILALIGGALLYLSLGKGLGLPAIISKIGQILRGGRP